MFSQTGRISRHTTTAAAAVTNSGRSKFRLETEVGRRLPQLLHDLFRTKPFRDAQAVAAQKAAKFFQLLPVIGETFS